MTMADATADGGTLAVPRPARQVPARETPARETPALKSKVPAQLVPAGRELPVLTVPAGRLEGRYWAAVARYLEDYRESYGPLEARHDGLIYRSPAQADADAARFLAGAEEAAEKALRAQRDIQEATSRLEAAQTALEKAPSWQRPFRGRLRAKAAREAGRRAATLHDLDEHSARMDVLLRESHRAALIAAVLRRSDQAHLAAAEAAGRGLGWRPGSPLPSRTVVYVAGPDGIEPLPAIAQRHPVTTVAVKRGSLRPAQDPVEGAGDLVGESS